MVIGAALATLVGDALDAILPARCPGCGRRVDRIVCGACAATLAPAPAAPPPDPVARWVSCFAYEGAARELVARAKYRNERRFLVVLAHELARAIEPAPVAIDLVTWAPASAARIRAHGVDHGELLARAVARLIGASVAPTLHRGPGPPQTGLDARARRLGPNLRAIDHVARSAILVVDDVATTGGTLAAAARALVAAEARTVCAATIARTPRPGGAAHGHAYTPATPAGIRTPSSMRSTWTSSSSASM
jgi:predicted amidophosphoribosyltransferase